MPELPDVEVLKRALLKFIVNSTIKRVKINNDNLRYKLPKNFKHVITNKRIIKINRRSKYLLIIFSDNSCLLIHLGMSGFIYLQKLKKKLINTSFYYKKNILKKHNHVTMYLNSDFILVYNDIRRFGFMKYFRKQFVYKNNFLSKLGPEPLSKKFNVKYLKAVAKKRKINIKTFLMDQTIVSGLGNIYVNEALFYSKINPLALCNSIKEQKLIVLIKNIKKVLIKSIKFGGSSIKNYTRITGQKGSFQQKFMVYNRDNLSCKRQNCKDIIKNIRISYRSSFYCPSCQE